MSSNQVDDVALKKIVDKLPHLSRLNISGNVTNNGLAEINRLKSLKTLDLQSKQVGNDGLANLTGCRQLQHLHVVAPVGDEGMVHLTELSNLTTLRCFSDPESTESSIKLEQQVS